MPTPNEEMMENSVEKRDDQRIEPLSVPDIRLFIQGKVRDLVNVSDNGFGILIDTPTDFHLGQRIDDIRLEMDGNLHRLQGAVAHITRMETGHLLGIRLVLNSIEEYRFVADLKNCCVVATEHR
ncbi:hypothetical protein [uncultured Desulfosarcina sp.]|uniref:hypothetical protein n=1 Tax=uncultured Desulfosarcina sp. TaxID=218289 RepID=UPI0029C903C1|nr:hypothetical protein [uncultured Desulfosarcina sp.]